jgi:hypothetical protein
VDNNVAEDDKAPLEKDCANLSLTNYKKNLVVLFIANRYRVYNAAIESEGRWFPTGFR